MDSLAVDSLERNSADAEAQRAARDIVTRLAPLKELHPRLTRVYGPTAERDIVFQLVYWFRKMPDRWTVYLTRKDWYEQRGLNREQVDKGRGRLRVHHLRIVTEKMGPYKRVHYQVDWVVLAEAIGASANLRPPLKGVPIEDDFDDLEDDILRPPLKPPPKPSAPPLGGTMSSAPPQMADTPDTYAANHANGGVPSNTVEYDSKLLSVESVLHTEMNGKKEKEEQPPTTEHPSQNGHTPSETTAVKGEVEEVVAPPKPDDDTLLAEVKEILDSNSGRWSYACYIKNDYPPEKVAGYIITNAEDIKRPEVVTSVPRDELEQAVGYVLWEAVA